MGNTRRSPGRRAVVEEHVPAAGRPAGPLRALIDLQRQVGNAALTAALSSPLSSPLNAARPAPPLRPVVQRAPAGLPGHLTDDINRVLDDTAGAARTDAGMLAAVRAAIAKAPAGERETARSDPRIVRRLPVDLTRASALVVLRSLGATLAQRLPTATGAGGVSPTAAGILTEIGAAPAAQRRAVLAEPALLAGIEGAVSRAEAMAAVTALGAALREVLDVGMRGAGAETAPMLAAAAAAGTGATAEVLGDGATMTLLGSRLARPDRLRMLGSLGAPVVDRLDATVSGSGPIDGTAAVRIAAATPAATRDVVRADRDLMARLQAGLAPVAMRDVLVALHASVADVLDAVLGTPAGAEADLVTVARTAAAAQRQAVLDDVALLGRLRTALPGEPYWHVRLMLAFGSPAAMSASSARVPALSNGAMHRADAHLAAGETTDAFTVVLASLTDRHRIDRTAAPTVVFSAGAAVDAETTFPGWAPNAQGLHVPTGPPTITVGPAALVGVPVLVSALLREAAVAGRGAKPTATDPGSPDATTRRAVEALLFEIEHRGAAGIGRDGLRLHELGTRLTAAYAAVPAAGQAQLKKRHDAALAVVAAVPATAAPAAAVSLTSALSSALTAVPPDTAGMLSAVQAATPAARAPVAGNHALVQQVTTALSRADAATVLGLLGAPLSQRIEFLTRAGAPAAELAAAVTAASVADRRSLASNRALRNALVAGLGDAEAASVLAALGGSLADELDRALLAAGPAAAVAAAVTAATGPRRAAAERDQALLERLQTALGAFETWRVRLLLRYGSAAALPGAATALLSSLAGAPAIGTVRLAFRKLTDPERTAARGLPGVRDVLAGLLPAPADLVIALRMLDLGMLDEETGLGGAVAETLQVPNAAGLYVPTPFSATSGFDLEYQRTGIVCTVRVNVTGPGPVVAANLPRSKSIWENNIEGGWNRRFKVTNANHDLPLVFNVNFTGAGAHHTVTAHAGVPVWPGLNMGNWFVDDPSTGAGNRAYVNSAAVHEFGHMIGNPDEYMLSQAHYLATVGTAGTTDPNASATADTAGTNSYTNTTSVMGGHLPGTNLPGPVQMRHVQFMLTWINAHRNPGEPAFTLATV